MKAKGWIAAASVPVLSLVVYVISAWVETARWESTLPDDAMNDTSPKVSLNVLFSKRMLDIIGYNVCSVDGSCPRYTPINMSRSFPWFLTPSGFDVSNLQLRTTTLFTP